MKLFVKFSKSPQTEKTVEIPLNQSVLLAENIAWNEMLEIRFPEKMSSKDLEGIPQILDAIGLHRLTKIDFSHTNLRNTFADLFTYLIIQGYRGQLDFSHCKIEDSDLFNLAVHPGLRKKSKQLRFYSSTFEVAYANTWDNIYRGDADFSRVNMANNQFSLLGLTAFFIICDKALSIASLDISDNSLALDCKQISREKGHIKAIQENLAVAWEPAPSNSLSNVFYKSFFRLASYYKAVNPSSALCEFMLHHQKKPMQLVIDAAKQKDFLNFFSRYEEQCQQKPTFTLSLQTPKITKSNSIQLTTDPIFKHKSVDHLSLVLSNDLGEKEYQLLLMALLQSPDKNISLDRPSTMSPQQTKEYNVFLNRLMHSLPDISQLRLKNSEDCRLKESFTPGQYEEQDTHEKGLLLPDNIQSDKPLSLSEENIYFASSGEKTNIFRADTLNAQSQFLLKLNPRTQLISNQIVLQGETIHIEGHIRARELFMVADTVVFAPGAFLDYQILNIKANQLQISGTTLYGTPAVSHTAIKLAGSLHIQNSTLYSHQASFTAKTGFFEADSELHSGQWRFTHWFITGTKPCRIKAEQLDICSSIVLLTPSLIFEANGTTSALAILDLSVLHFRSRTNRALIDCLAFLNAPALLAASRTATKLLASAIQKIMGHDPNQNDSWSIPSMRMLIQPIIILLETLSPTVFTGLTVLRLISKLTAMLINLYSFEKSFLDSTLDNQEKYLQALWLAAEAAEIAMDAISLKEACKNLHWKDFSAKSLNFSDFSKIGKHLFQIDNLLGLLACQQKSVSLLHTRISSLSLGIHKNLVSLLNLDILSFASLGSHREVSVSHAEIYSRRKIRNIYLKTNNLTNCNSNLAYQNGFIDIKHLTNKGQFSADNVLLSTLSTHNAGVIETQNGAYSSLDHYDAPGAETHHKNTLTSYLNQKSEGFLSYDDTQNIQHFSARTELTPSCRRHLKNTTFQINKFSDYSTTFFEGNNQVSSEEYTTSSDTYYYGSTLSIEAKQGTLSAKVETKNLSIYYQNFSQQEVNDLLQKKETFSKVSPSDFLRVEIDQPYHLSGKMKQSAAIEVIAKEISINSSIEDKQHILYFRSKQGDIDINQQMDIKALSLDSAGKVKVADLNNGIVSYAQQIQQAGWYVPQTSAKPTVQVEQLKSKSSGDFINNGTIKTHQGTIQSSSALHNSGYMKAQNHLEIVADKGVHNHVQEAVLYHGGKDYVLAEIVGGSGEGDTPGLSILSENKVINGGRMTAIGKVYVYGKLGIEDIRLSNTFLYFIEKKKNKQTLYHQTNTSNPVIGSSSQDVELISSEGNVQYSNILAPEGSIEIFGKTIQSNPVAILEGYKKSQRGLFSCSTSETFTQYILPCVLAAGKTIKLVAKEKADLKDTVIIAQHLSGCAPEINLESTPTISHSFSKKSGFSLQKFSILQRDIPIQGGKSPDLTSLLFPSLSALYHSTNLEDVLVNSYVLGAGGLFSLKQISDPAAFLNIKNPSPSVLLGFGKQSVAKTSMSAGASFVLCHSMDLTATNKIELNGIDITVIDEGIIKTPQLIQRGTLLANTYHDKRSSVNIKVPGFQPGVILENTTSDAFYHKPQSLNVGHLHVEADNWQIQNAQTITKKLSGQVKTLEMVSFPDFSVQAHQYFSAQSAGVNYQKGLNKSTHYHLSSLSPEDGKEFHIGELISNGGMLVNIKEDQIQRQSITPVINHRTKMQIGFSGSPNSILSHQLSIVQFSYATDKRKTILSDAFGNASNFTSHKHHSVNLLLPVGPLPVWNIKPIPKTAPVHLSINNEISELFDEMIPVLRAEPAEKTAAKLEKKENTRNSDARLRFFPQQSVSSSNHSLPVLAPVITNRLAKPEMEYVYRGDSRGTKEIFRDGFHAHGENPELIFHLKGLLDPKNKNNKSRYISTTKDKLQASSFPLFPNHKLSYVYEINPSTDAIDMVKAFEFDPRKNKLDPALLEKLNTEKEIVFDSFIRPTQIKGAWMATYYGKWDETNWTPIRSIHKTFIPNPKYISPIAGEVMLWSISKSFGHSLSALGYAEDAARLAYSYKQSQLIGNYNDFYQEVAGTTGAIAVGTSVSLLSAELGTVACLPLFPPVGSLVCGLGGGIVGSLAGSAVGEKIGHMVFKNSNNIWGFFNNLSKNSPSFQSEKHLFPAMHSPGI